MIKKKAVLVGRVLRASMLTGGKFFFIEENEYRFLEKQEFDKIFKQYNILNCRFGHGLHSIIKSMQIKKLSIYNEEKELIKLGYDEEWVIESAINYLQERKVSGALTSGAIYDPESVEAEEHAVIYYGLVRSRKDDVEKISRRTNIPKSTIQEVKDYIFMDKHELGGVAKERFAPDCAMAQSWQRLVGDMPEPIQPHDILLLRHEIEEIKFVKDGMSQSEAHGKASEKYNYARASASYYKNKLDRRKRK